MSLQAQDAEDANSKSLVNFVQQAARLKVLSGHVWPVDTATSGLGHPLYCVDMLWSALQHCRRAQSDLVKQFFDYCVSSQCLFKYGSKQLGHATQKLQDQAAQAVHHAAAADGCGARQAAALRAAQATAMQAQLDCQALRKENLELVASMQKTTHASNGAIAELHSQV